jgi:hypothetical protein
MSTLSFSKKIVRGLLAGGALCIALTLPTLAQVQSSETMAHGPSIKQVTIQRGEVVYAYGNDMMIKMEDGSLQDFFNVPEDMTVTVDGRQLNVYQMKPGMKIEKQTITTTTPRLVTKVETVTGKVFHVTPPNSVILTLEDGTNQRFSIPKGQKFTISGKETDAFGLRKGMMVSATRITETPETIVAQEIRHTGTLPPAPSDPSPGVPILVASGAPATAPAESAATEPAPTQLPKTASNLPLFGLLGVLFCGIALAAIVIRKLIA